jgi:hypothetical protein
VCCAFAKNRASTADAQDLRAKPLTFHSIFGSISERNHDGLLPPLEPPSTLAQGWYQLGGAEKTNSWQCEI